MTIFAKIISGELPASIVHRDHHCIAFMDIHPMARGHVLVCPLTAVPRLDELDRETRAHLWEVSRNVAIAQRAALGSHAQHYLVNDGPGANQTVPHVHIHVIPRYAGDRLKTVARMIMHIGVLVLSPPISARKRQELDTMAAEISAALQAT